MIRFINGKENTRRSHNDPPLPQEPLLQRKGKHPALSQRSATIPRSALSAEWETPGAPTTLHHYPMIRFVNGKGNTGRSHNNPPLARDPLLRQRKGKHLAIPQQSATTTWLQQDWVHQELPPCFNDQFKSREWSVLRIPSMKLMRSQRCPQIYLQIVSSASWQRYYQFGGGSDTHSASRQNYVNLKSYHCQVWNFEERWHASNIGISGQRQFKGTWYIKWALDKTNTPKKVWFAISFEFSLQVNAKFMVVVHPHPQKKLASKERKATNKKSFIIVSSRPPPPTGHTVLSIELMYFHHILVILLPSVNGVIHLTTFTFSFERLELPYSVSFESRSMSLTS